MRMREYAPQPVTVEAGDGRRSLRGFMFQGQAAAPPLPRGQAPAARARPRPAAWTSPVPGILELATSVSGVALAVFMVMHLSLLSTVLVGAQTMDALASFLERYYLVFMMTPPLLFLGLAHVFLTVRKAPNTFQQQRILLRQMRWLRHLDTWTWGFQLTSGVALLALASIHLWVILTDLPIEAAKSGAHVSGIYLWLDIPFVLLVQGHIAVGLYRVALKWGLLARRWAYGALALYTAIALGLSFTVMATFYSLGGEL